MVTVARSLIDNSNYHKTGSWFWLKNYKNSLKYKIIVIRKVNKSITISTCFKLDKCAFTMYKNCTESPCAT
jgi:hypothetical protein